MAGDWIKVEEAMPDKPEVAHIATTLNLDLDAVSGKLLRVWVWASRNCHADGVTKVTAMLAIDRAAGVTGFAQAMVSAGWLIVEGDELRFPNFDRHNTKTAKDRALAAKRQEHKRHADVTKMSRSQRDGSVTREREEKENIKPTPKSSPKNSGSGVGGILTNLKAEDLKNLDRLNQIADSIPRFRSEHGRLVIVAAALRAMDNAKTSPGGMFRTLVETDPGKLGELVEPYMQEASQRMRSQKPRNSPQTHAAALAEAFAVPKQGNTS